MQEWLFTGLRARRWRRHNWTVWELTIADNHNFTILTGQTPVLVHNTSCSINSDGNS